MVVWSGECDHQRSPTLAESFNDGALTSSLGPLPTENVEWHFTLLMLDDDVYRSLFAIPSFRPFRISRLTHAQQMERTPHAVVFVNSQGSGCVRVSDCGDCGNCHCRLDSGEVLADHVLSFL